MKTLKNLERKISFFFSGYGHNKLTIIYRGKEYKCTSSNTQATDRIKDDNEGVKDSYYKTKKQAYLSLYNEVKRANNLK
jgi:competence protein ComGF